MIFTSQPHGENTSGAYLGKGSGSLQEKVMERRNRWDFLSFSVIYEVTGIMLWYVHIKVNGKMLAIPPL